MKNLYKYSLKRTYIGKIGENSSTYTVNNSSRVKDILRQLELHKEEQENLIVFMPDTKNKIKGFYTSTKGTCNSSPAHAREIFRIAILHGAVTIIIAHNHPSGEVYPSSGDLAITKKLQEAGKIIGIKVCDHIIVGEDMGEFRSYSMAENSLMD